MLRWIGVAVLFVLLCAEVAAHGPLRLEAPRTILSNAARVQKETEPYFLFLRWVAPRVPPGARLAIRTPAYLWYFVALGQLPDQIVVPATGERGPLSPDAGDADWVACYFANLDDPRYRRVASYVPNGSLYQRLR
ncbi:MAG TPA: hypothetical protein VGK26_10895 [Thermoanaerobaculia bacterium]|jgi:hypothetical protein